MQLTVTTFSTLDGVMQAPGGATEDPSGGFAHGGWVIPHIDEDFGHLITAIFDRADAFLFGRHTYEAMAGHWPQVTDPDDLVAARLNQLPKYVVSSTLTEPVWHDTRVVAPDDLVRTVLDLKAADGAELQVHGSAELVQSLIQHRLVDAYNVWTFPVVLGSGKRLFGPGTVPTALEHLRTDVTSGGVVVTAYRPSGGPRTGGVDIENGRTVTAERGR